MFVILVHYVADFVLQTNKQAINKSVSNKYLSYHVGTYSAMWFIAMLGFFMRWELALLFSIVTFISHFVTDYFTSRWVKYFREKEDYHNMFVIIGGDQVLHYFQLFLTLKLCLKYY